MIIIDIEWHAYFSIYAQFGSHLSISCIYVSMSNWNLRWNQTARHIQFLFPELLNGCPNSRFRNVIELLMNARTCAAIFLRVAAFFVVCFIFNFTQLVSFELINPSLTHTHTFTFYRHPTMKRYRCVSLLRSMLILSTLAVYVWCFIRKWPIKLSYHYNNWSH